MYSYANATSEQHLTDDNSAQNDISHSSTHSGTSQAQSLEWDGHSLTVNLSPVDDRIRLFSNASSEFQTESSLDEVFIPNLEEPDSPPSPFLRMTRNTLRSGGYVRISESVRVSTMSSEGSLFLRNNPLRKPILKVKIRNDDISPISDATAHARSLADTPPSPDPASGSDSPQ